MSDVRAELSALIQAHPWNAADAILARFAVLGLPEPSETTGVNATWEWDADRRVRAILFPTGGAAVTTSEGLIFYTARGDTAEELAAALCAAARHARTLAAQPQSDPNNDRDRTS